MPIVKSLKLFLDDRGYLYEMLRADDPFFKSFGQAYISAINPGVVKGFHKHMIQTDHIVCVQGQIKLVLVDEGQILQKISEYHLSPLDPKIVVVEPGIWHGWMCVGNEPALVINFSTHVHDKSNPDEERVDPHQNPWQYVWEIKDK